MSESKMTVTIDPDLKKRVRVAAAEKEISMSEWIREAAQEKLQREAGEGNSKISPMAMTTSD